jgi:hypothetical protein
MPFVMAEVFEDCMLPKNLEPYWKELIQPLFKYDLNNTYDLTTDALDEELGKICYLTIQESYVEANTSQRRPGLHTDNPGKLQIKCDGQCINSSLPPAPTCTLTCTQNNI